MFELRGVGFSLVDNGVTKIILDNVSFSVSSGQFVVITGPNGSGKSTLAQIIMGIKTPDSGKILLNKSDITKLNITERAKLGIAYAFQQPIKLKGITVFELLNITNGELMSTEMAGKYLKQVGLAPDEYLSREINSELSGGELKRIEIASVLARNAKVMVFDEPEAGIDMWSFDNLIQIFKKLKSDNRTVIVISHQEKLMKMADEIVMLRDGKIEACGAPMDILPEIKGAKK